MPKPLYLVLLLGLLVACLPSSPPPSLQASLGQSTLSITHGESINLAMTFIPQGGFNATVNLVLEKQDGTPAPAGLSLSPSIVAVSGSAPVAVNLTLTSNNSTPTGTPHALRVRAAGGGLSTTCGGHCASFTLYVGARGELDPSFGTGGKVVTPVGTGSHEAYALVLQPDGRLVAAGYSYNGSNYYFALVRYY